MRSFGMLVACRIFQAWRHKVDESLRLDFCLPQGLVKQHDMTHGAALVAEYVFATASEHLASCPYLDVS